MPIELSLNRRHGYMCVFMEYIFHLPRVVALQVLLLVYPSQDQIVIGVLFET